METISLNSQIDYRFFLKEEFESRKNKNKLYSLRAFARDLKMDQGHLSLVLSHKKNLSLLKANDISKRLYKNPHKIKVFNLAIQLENQTEAFEKKKITDKIISLSQKKSQREPNISEDEFNLISDWYHLPILELTGIRNDIDAKTAARYIGISQGEAKTALMRLLRLKFVKIFNHKYFKKIKSVSTTTDIPSFAIRSFHFQILEKARLSLSQTPVNQRHNSGLTVRIPKNKIRDYKNAIEEFEKKIIALSDAFDSECDEIYQLSLHFFPLSKETNHD
jgi:uncharacterized protein (TIGR02147 family)